MGLTIARLKERRGMLIEQTCPSLEVVLHKEEEVRRN